MNILIVGALSWNPERIISLCERGHKLFGLWTKTMAWEQGPYKFAEGFITDVTLDNYIDVIKKEKVDIIYSLFQTYPPSHWSDVENTAIHDIWQTLRRIFSDRNKGLFDVPIVRHWGFDSYYLDREVVKAFDGHIFCNLEKYIFWITPKDKGGFGVSLPLDAERLIFMDSDLPKGEFGNDNFSRKLSEADGQIHTVCVGRPFSLNYYELARRKIHVHIYGNNFDDVIKLMAPDIPIRKIPGIDFSYVHLHPSLQTINQSLAETRAIKNRWVSEFSQYDAGWSYVQARRWSLLDNRAVIPNRLSTYIIAGLPVIAETLPGYYRYDVLKENGIQIDFSRDDYDGLSKKLSDKGMMHHKAGSVLACRKKFLFDYYIDDLIRYFEFIRKTYHAKPRPLNVPQFGFEENVVDNSGSKKSSVSKEFLHLFKKVAIRIKVAYLKNTLRKNGNKTAI